MKLVPNTMIMAKTWTMLFRHLDNVFVERAYHYACVAPLYGQEHRHADRCHIAYLFSGGTTIRVGGSLYPVGPGDMIFIRAKTPHASLGDEKTEYELIEVHFAVTSARGLASFPSIGPVVHVHNPASIVPVLEGLVEAHLIDPGRDNWLAKVRLVEALLLMQRESRRLATSAKGPSDIGIRIQLAREYVAINYARPLTVTHLADVAGMSASHFAACFRRIAGVSPIEFVIRTRLFHAKQLLTASGFSVNQVAALCGFASPQYMARVFHRRESRSPKAFR
jgi:AraC-like DNA-binding protein